MSSIGMATTATDRYRVLIADDHSLIRHGVRAVLASQPDLEICSEASNGIETIDRVKRDKPNLVILDLAMPGMNGLDVARMIRGQWPETEVMILSMHFTDEIAHEVLTIGALAYVLKSDADTELLVAVDHVRHGQPFFTGKLTASMMHKFLDDSGGLGAEAKDVGTMLTVRQCEVLRLLAEGRSNKEAATALSVSTRTIESHRDLIMHKMGFKTFSDLVRFAIRNAIIRT